MRLIVMMVLLMGCAEERKAAERTENAEVARDRARKAEDSAREAMATVEQLERDHRELDKRFTIAVDAVAAAASDADHTAAKAKLDQLMAERKELEARIAEAKQKAAKAKRMQGVNVSEECKQNPLAKGCS